MRRRGFTFIEVLLLLLTVAIVVVILLPVLATVRAKGRRTQCISNLRQIGMAIELYSHNYDGMLPPWLNRRHDGSGTASKWDNPENLYNALRPRIKNNAVLFCPTDPYAGKDEDRFLVNHSRSSYFFNLRPRNRDRIYLRITGLFVAGKLRTPPADYPLIRDANAGLTGPPGRRPSRGCQHAGGVNVFYLDGHAKWKRNPYSEGDLEVS